MNVYDPKRWNNIDNKLIDVLVENDPIRDCEINFQKNKNFRHFSTAHYIRKIPNGEKHYRKWLVYFNILIEYIAFAVNYLISILKK